MTWVSGSDLLDTEHEVLGLCRSDEKAALPAAKGATALRGSLEDIDLLAQAASDANAVVHTAFGHDFSKFAKNAEQDRRMIEATGAPLIGTGKPILVTTGLLMQAPGKVAGEADMPPLSDPNYPGKTEVAVRNLTEHGVKIGVVRLAPTVHGIGDGMFMKILADHARETGVSAYIGDGANRWSAVHVSDVGRGYRLALEAVCPRRHFTRVWRRAYTFEPLPERSGRTWACRSSRDHASILAGSRGSLE